VSWSARVNSSSSTWQATSTAWLIRR
jgi:hypothetical protein